MTQDGRIQELTKMLNADLSAPHQKYPDQAVYALQDPSVAKRITERFEASAILADVKTLGYDLYTGLNRIFFEFTGRDSLVAEPDAILVLLDEDCRVVGLVDPFNPAQPNRLVGRVHETESNVPFVLNQPSTSDSLFFSVDDLGPGEERTRRFFSALSPSGSIAQGFGIEVGPGLSACFGSSDTRSPGYCGGGAMVCRQVTGLLAPHCDAWDRQRIPDEVGDD